MAVVKTWGEELLGGFLSAGLAAFLAGCQSHPASDSSDRLAPGERPLYEHIQVQLSAYRQGEPLGQLLTGLHVQDAPFDDLYTNMPGHEDRAYHRGRYFLRMDIEQRDGQLYTRRFLPTLEVDGLTREQRLQKSHEALAGCLTEKQERLESTRRDRQ